MISFGRGRRTTRTKGRNKTHEFSLGELESRAESSELLSVLPGSSVSDSDDSSLIVGDDGSSADFIDAKQGQLREK